MKYRTLLKDTRREIWRTKSRFLSIFAIVMLGVGFFAGIKATCPDMKLTAETYYQESRLMDVRLLSTYGFDEEDAEAVRGTEGVHTVMPQYSADFLCEDGENDVVIRVYSYDPDSKGQTGENDLNRPVLVEGRFPEKSGECVIEDGVILPETFAENSKVKLFSGTDADLSEMLKTDTFEVVGVVESPLYVSFERGSTTIGNGSVTGFILIPEEDFASEVYTDLYITFDETAEMSPFTNAYQDAVDEGSEKVKKSAEESVRSRYERIVSDAEKELEDAREELKKAKDEQKEALAEALRQIEDGRSAYNSAYIAYWKEKDRFTAAIDIGKQELDAGREELQKNREDFEKLEGLYQGIAALAGLPEGQALTSEQEALIAASGELDPSLPQLITAAVVMRDPAAVAMLPASLEQIGEQLGQVRDALDAGEEELDRKAAELAEKEKQGLEEFASAKRTLDRTYEELAQAERDYDHAKQESDRQIADAEAEIKDGEKELAEIEEPKLYLFDRDSNPGYSGYENDANRIDAIARIFPAFFIFVAALVCLTTMTRMVEEQRTVIGTFKALGYSKGAIVSKYLLYALTASFFGSVTGLLIGFQLFPGVIYSAYRIMYILPPLIAPFHFDSALWCTAAAMAVTGLSTLFACYAELSAQPSQLMRPKPPKNGKRILLERVRWLWNRISFIRKVTIRNFFRYKRRIILTITGIAGCTALMLTGFGLKDSISTIVDRQFHEIYSYDAIAAFDTKEDPDRQKKRDDLLSGREEIEDYLYAYQSSVDAKAESGSKVIRECNLVVPEDAGALSGFVNFRAYGTGEELQPVKGPSADTTGEVIVTAKLADKLGLGTGDSVRLTDGDDKTVSAVIGGIAENYVFHYIYMHPDTYEALYGERPEPNLALIDLTEEAASDSEEFSHAMLKDDSVVQLSLFSETSKRFSDIIERLNTVVYVLILSAGALALIVLYNLISINVNERIRELATLKVLGFYNKEVSSYINRESVASSVIGILFGLVLGIFLHRFVITTAEVDIVMFAREIFPLSYLGAAVLTFAFTLGVNFLLHFRLKKIDMVESLKSVE